MDGYYLPFSGRPKASSQGARHGMRVSAASRPCRLPAELSPGFRGDFCSKAAVAGAPWRCQPWSNPMPKLSGFMQGLNLNLGKEKEERKASLIAGLALNPSGGGDLLWAALSGAMALCKRARSGGGEFQIPKSLQPGFAGSRWDAAASGGAPRAVWLACGPPKPWAAAWVLQPPYSPRAKGVRRSAWGWPGASPSPPRPRSPKRGLGARQPGGRLLSHCWLRPQHSAARSTAGTCSGFAAPGGQGGCTAPQRGGGDVQPHSGAGGRRFPSG